MPHVNPPRYTPVEVERFVNKEMEDGTHRVREFYNGIDQYPAYEDFTLKVQLESGVPLQEIPPRWSLSFRDVPPLTHRLLHQP